MRSYLICWNDGKECGNYLYKAKGKLREQDIFDIRQQIQDEFNINPNIPIVILCIWKLSKGRKEEEADDNI